MRAIANRIDKFCREHPGFGIPNLMLYIAIGNVAVAFLDTFSRSVSLSSLLFFSRSAILHGQIWRLVTFVFVPSDSSIFFAAISAYFYYWIGTLLEREWGTGKFTVFYLAGVVLNIIFGFVAGFASMYYVNLSLFFAFAALYPNMQVLLFFIIPIKVKWLAWLDAFLFVWSALQSLLAGSIMGALLPVVALLNFFIFFADDFMTAMGFRKARYAHQHSKQTVNFKKATAKAYQEKGYIHKCAVCGKTDTEFPDMEFRYCSKCNGYYCYCQDHINNHIHIQ